MDLTSLDNKNSFDPTPRLKSSPVPILFIPFNKNEESCNYCGNYYSMTLLFDQKYCKNCFAKYIRDTIDNDNTCLDVLIGTNINVQCIKHGSTRNKYFGTQDIQEWCKYCSEVAYFKQVFSSFLSKSSCCLMDFKCSLCGKCSTNIGYIEFRLCSNCYLISLEKTESTLNKNSVLILYLSWWDILDQCMICEKKLCFMTESQKRCLSCRAIYTGCRYCLTTNIIFGVTDQSQCKKCKRILSIIANYQVPDEIDEILRDTTYYQIVDYIDNNVDKNSALLDLYKDKSKYIYFRTRKIPYHQITKLKKVAEGGFGTVYRANWFDKTVAVKKFSNRRISKHFLNELKSFCQFSYNYGNIIKCHGFTREPATGEYTIIMDFADGGDLYNYLQKNFAKITWEQKLNILLDILNGLGFFHYHNFIHRDLHSMNILSFGNNPNEHWLIGDLGLLQSVNSTSSNNDRYGMLSYTAPEILKDFPFSKASDIYSMGMIMWELTSGCRPFADFEHDINIIYGIIDGKRPKITNDTPECFANLMKKCWDSDPLERPTVTEIQDVLTAYMLSTNDQQPDARSEIQDVLTAYMLSTNDQQPDARSEMFKIKEQFKQAEKSRIELIRSRNLGPEFSKKFHSKVTLSTNKTISCSSKSSIINSLPINSVEREYITKEYDLDINTINNTQRSCHTPNCMAQGTSAIYTSRLTSSMTSLQKYNSREYELDINNIQRFCKSSSRKRNLEDSHIENQDHVRSRIKI